MTNPAPSSSSSRLLYPLPVTESGPGRLFAILATTTIAAKPSSVLDVVLDYRSYGEWNSFVPGVIVDSHPAVATSTGPEETQESDRLKVGTRFTQTIYMNGGGLSDQVKSYSAMKNPCLLTSLEVLKDGRKGFEVQWIPTKYPYWLLHSVRVQEFVETEDGQTLYTSKETFGGLLSWIVLWFLSQKLVLRFSDWATDLKAAAERREQHRE